jgi:hypothetical protein
MHRGAIEKPGMAFAQFRKALEKCCAAIAKCHLAIE